MFTWFIKICRGINTRRLLNSYSIFQVVCCGIRVLAATYASIVHDKIYLLLFIGASLYLCSAAIGRVRPSECVVVRLEEALFHQKCVFLTVVNVISFCIDSLTIAYLISWQAFYESRTYLIILLACALGIQLVIQFFVIWILAEFIESLRPTTRAVLPLTQVASVGDRLGHSEIAESTSSPIPRDRVNLNVFDKPATPFSNPPVSVRLSSVSSAAGSNLNRSNSDPVYRRSSEEYLILKMRSN